MNKRIKARWLKALRSGKYKQCTGNLKTTEGHCCLGVLCELHARSTKTDWTERESPVYSYLGPTLLPPAKVIEWAGLEADDPTVLWKGENSSLSWLNDQGFSFKRIARLIE